MSAQQSPPQSCPQLDQFRNYLRFLADVKLDRRLRGRVDPSDIVQETMLKAFAAWNNFRGTESGQRAAWLRQILLREALHALRRERCDKRAVTREQRLDYLLDQSSQRIESWLAADETSPSVAAQESEQMLQIADAVYQLPDAERVAITCYYWQGATLAEVGAEVGRTAPAAAGLVHRGLQRLRTLLGDEAFAAVK